MKYLSALVLLSLLSCSGSTSDTTEKSVEEINYSLFIGSYTSQSDEGIYSVNLNSASGELQLNGLAASANNPSFLDVVNDRLVSVSETSGGSLISFGIDFRTLRLYPLDTLRGVGDAPCYVALDKTGFGGFVANYVSGDVLRFGIDNQGRFIDDTIRVKHDGSGPILTRQESAHAHSIDLNPVGNRVYAADLGTDKVYVYDPSDLSLLDIIEMDPGDGPRHFEFSAGGNMLYVINELSSTISVFEVKDGKHRRIQKISTLPADYQGENKTADIHLHPSVGFLYGSNRGHDSIVYYTVLEDGKLELGGWLNTDISWPRNFAVSPDGNWLLVANRNSNLINSFPLIDGIPGKMQSAVNINSPVCVRFYVK